VEGSESRDFGNHELLSLGLLGGMMMSLWKPKSHETCIDLTLHKKPTNKTMSASDKPFQRRRKPYPDIREGP
jgi:hypothetical protein